MIQKRHEFDVGVFIGRFQPLHIGHTRIIDEALSRCTRVVIIVGSAGGSRTIKNPFTFCERKHAIETGYKYQVRTGHLVVVAQSDLLESDEAWAHEVRRVVEEHTPRDGSVALTGFSKDASSYYLKMFPNWSSIQLSSQVGTLNSTDIRAAYLKPLPVWPRDILPDGSNALLDEFRWTQDFQQLVAEARYYAEYPSLYGKGPFLTADNIVWHNGQILLVTRGKVPGKGKLALPGGFRNPNERLFDAALRELREETGLDLRRKPAVAVFEQAEVWDNPYRSLRGDVVTYVVSHSLVRDFDRSTLKAADDAADLGFYDFDALPPDRFFDDHWSIINAYKL